MNYMKNDVRIVKQLPARLQSLDLEAIGSQVGASALFNNFRHLTSFTTQRNVGRTFAHISLLHLSQITDMEISKEAEPSEFVKSILPILQQNGVVHFLGFGNRLGFDSVPVHLQVAIGLSKLNFT